MTPEQVKLGQTSTVEEPTTSIEEPKITLEELEQLLEKKKLRLPKSIRAHIRTLKSEGRWEQAMRIAAIEREKKEKKIEVKRRSAERELYQSIGLLLETEDPQIQGVEEIRAIWLLHASGVIDSDEKTKELIDILDSRTPDLKAYLERRLLDIRVELQPLLPMREKITSKRGRRV